MSCTIHATLILLHVFEGHVLLEFHLLTHKGKEEIGFCANDGEILTILTCFAKSRLSVITFSAASDPISFKVMLSGIPRI